VHYLPPRRADRRGFTLIELIVVVIIIAVLAAIAAVAYNQYASRARSNAVLASASSLRTAIMAASARDDQAPAAEVDTLWTAAGGDSAAFLQSLSADYSGPLTYAPGAADGSAPAVLQVGDTSGNHAAYLTLPDTVSQPVTLTAGAYSGDSSEPVTEPCAPAPMPGCTVHGTVTASAEWASMHYYTANGNDGDLGTFWDPNSATGWWQVAFDAPTAVSAVNFATHGKAGGTMSVTVSKVDDSNNPTTLWTGTITVPAGLTPTVYTAPVPAGTYDRIRITFRNATLYAVLDEVTIS